MMQWTHGTEGMTRIMLTIEQEITALEENAGHFKQYAEWLSILKKAKFEYDEAWKIITHPTPDVTYADRDRAQTILDVFKDSLGRLDG